LQDAPRLLAQQAMLKATDFNQPITAFLASTFVPGMRQVGVLCCAVQRRRAWLIEPPQPAAPAHTLLPCCPPPQALTSTVEGDVVVWECPPSGGAWCAIKLLRLHQGPVRVVTTCGSHVVTGGDDGMVRFYDKR
jgi:hypothetical protein